jgi:hypothetical protein
MTDASARFALAISIASWSDMPHASRRSLEIDWVLSGQS